MLLDEIPQTCEIPAEGRSSVAGTNEYYGATSLKLEAFGASFDIPE
jgi:hypothetical protein